MAKLALAHYFPPYPLQLTTAPYPNDYYALNYLNPTGDGSGNYGPLLRNRPTKPGPLTGDWALNNAKIEVNQAKAGGLDGFIVDILTATTNGSNNNSKFGNAVFQAGADLGGFTVVPMLDVSGSLASLTAAQAATVLDHYLSYSSAWVEGGEYVFMAFLAEAWSTSKWQDVIDALSTTYGKTCKFFPCFNSATPLDSGTYDSVAWGLTQWGGRSTASNNITTWTNRGNAVQGRGKKWMHPIAFQDERPNQHIFDEASNTETLRLMWQAARACDADYTQNITWNDYSECTTLAPSRDLGDAILLANKHYIRWWKDGGSEPAPSTSLGQEMVVITHRKQFAADKGSYPGLVPMKIRGGSTAARDTLEALCFLDGPGTLVLQSGDTSFNFALDSGVTAKNIPLRPGIQKASIVRA